MKYLLMFLLLLVLFSCPMSAADCIDVDLGAQLIPGSPLSALGVYFYLINCGTEPGMMDFTITLTRDSTPLGEAQSSAYPPAGEPFSKKCELPIPPGTPAGTYTLCITATLGQASDTACATVTIDAMGNIIGFEKGKGPSPNEERTWGQIKVIYN